MRDRRLLPVVLMVALSGAFLLYGFGKWIVPFAQADREELVTTPGVPALFQRATVPLRPGSEACFGLLQLRPEATVARFRVFATGEPVPLEVTASGPGYSARDRVADYVTGGDALAFAQLTPPERPVTGRLCIRNAGRRRVELVGTNEFRSLVLPTLRVDGRAIDDIDIELAFLAPGQRSLLERPGQLLDRASAFAQVPLWILWPVLVLIALGLPAGGLAALTLAARADLLRRRDADA